MNCSGLRYRSLPISGSYFTYRIHRLVTRDRAQRCARCAKTLTGVHSLLYEAVILPNYVVQIRSRPAQASAAQAAESFKLAMADAYAR